MIKWNLAWLVGVILFFATRTWASYDVTLTLNVADWTDKPNSVSLAGTFNNWSKDAMPLKKTGDNVWSTTISLEEGSYQYKFVIDGTRWIADPSADPKLDVDDTFGGKNSGLNVGPDPAKLGPVEDNKIVREALLFNPKNLTDLNVVDEHHVRLRVRTLANDVQTVQVELKSTATQALHKLTTERGFDVYGGVLETPITPVEFRFNFAEGSAKVSLGANGASESSASYFSVNTKDNPVVTPAWARDAVWYQIFPERFRNGDPTNDPGDRWYERLTRWNSNWWQAQPGEAEGDENFYKGKGNVWQRRYGGDLKGVQDELPYLRSLGVNAIYLNPIFEAESMHKYDTADYRHVDDNFGVRDNPTTQPIGAPERKEEPWTPGGNKKLYELDGTPVADDYKETDDPKTWKWTKSDLMFLNFLKESKAQGFHVIIDGVFNHVGRAHPFFQDVIQHGKESKYADWFDIQAFPTTLPAVMSEFGKDGGLKYRAWDQDSGHLPVFRKTAETGLAPGPRDHILAITRRWLNPDNDPKTDDGIDGWRLDVPGDIPDSFWRVWRKTVKDANPNAYISGEIWSEAQNFLNRGDEFDGVMNYQFATLAQRFFVDQETAMQPSKFVERMVQLTYIYPLQSAEVVQNLFDSHDTDRIASMMVNPDRPYDGQNRPQDNAADHPYSAAKPNETQWQKLKLAVSWQMTFVGAPMIYYGNEAGMWGPDDPSNRMPMLWRDLQPYDDAEMSFNQDVFDHHVRTIAIRNTYEALRTGEFYPVAASDDANTVVFARKQGTQVVYVAINRSATAASVSFPVEESLAGKTLVNVMDATQADVKSPADSPTARPTIQIKPDAAGIKVGDNSASITVSPYSAAILVAKE